ncbi:MAG: Yip1 family protein [Bacteroidota bacterium]
MVQCPVCKTENDDFAITCLQCHSYLQNRIPNLDLFEMVWKVIESPRKAFRAITLAEHKNYSLFLFSLFGISLTFTAFWYFRLGDRFANLLDLIIWALLGGLALGVVVAPLTSGLHFLLTKLLKGKATFRNSFGVMAYSLIPVVVSLVLILPIELLTFGMYLFTSNPNPFTIKPLEYAILLGFDAVVGLWSILLAILGTRVSQRLSVPLSTIVVAVILVMLGGLFFYAGTGLQARLWT